MEAAGKRYITYPSRSDKFRLWNLSDVHLLSKGCAEDKFRDDVAEIRGDPYSLWVGGGDYCDFIGYKDKRFDPDATADYIPIKALADLGRYGMRRFRDIVKPIAGKCLGLLRGNHEKTYELHTETELLESWLCEELGVPCLQYSAMMWLMFCRTGAKKVELRTSPAPGRHLEKASVSSFKLFLHHGAGFAQTPGGKLNKLIQFMQSFDADIYMIGHVHDKVGRKEPALTVDKTGTTIIQRERLGVVSGSYLRTYTEGYTSYGEQRGYRPTSLGPAVIEIHPNTRNVRGEV